MHFQYLPLLAAATLLTSATASPAPAATPEPATGAQITNFANDVLNYVTATLANSPEFTSVLSVVENNPSASAALESWDQNASKMIASGVTSVAAVVSAMPTELQSFYSSVYEVELSLAYKDGVLTSTNSKGAAPTGVGAGLKLVGGAAAAAVVGVMAL